jgi:hypothetical protein
MINPLSAILLSHPRGALHKGGPAKRAERAETQKSPTKWASDEDDGYGQ